MYAFMNKNGTNLIHILLIVCKIDKSNAVTPIFSWHDYYMRAKTSNYGLKITKGSNVKTSDYYAHVLPVHRFANCVN